MPKLTCITTTYNEGFLLLNAVRSVLNQSFRDFEYLIVDDGSADETLEILDQLDDPRLKVIRQSNAGLSAARNAGIAAAQGDYICFLDADDLRPNWSFAVIVKAIDATQPDLILCPGMLCDRRGQIEDFYDASIFAQISQNLPHGISARHQPEHRHICTLAQQTEPQSANKVLRRDFLLAAGLYFPAPYFFEDVYFHTLSIAKANRIAFLDVPAFTYFQRYERPQITATTGALRFDIIAVAKLTLDAFALLPEFGDAAYRTVVLASCLKLIDWCELCLAYPMRSAFRQNAENMIALIDQRFKEIQSDQVIAPAFLASLGKHIEALAAGT
jgi:glycosyltransferase involved in cell wall biosynthesis